MTRAFASSALLAGVLFWGACASHPPAAVPDGLASTAAYDSALAARLGADAYGMHPYILALLRAGPNRNQDSAAAAALLRAHLANIGRMAREGTLVLAGPFLDGGERPGDLQGIYVFNVATVEEARALTATDPAIRAGRLVMELHPWYGSAALQALTPIHQRISRGAP